jgi:UDP-N-acetylglucosamine acyltransferase
MSQHPTAIIDESALLGEAVQVGPYAVVEGETRIGERCELRAHVTVKRFSELGPDTVVHEGAVIGGEPQDVSFTGLPSRLRIGARNRIREGVTIHRSSRAGGITEVGSDGFFMAYSHVAHDCRVGDRVILANNVALAGHVEVQDGAFLSGGVVVHQFCRVGRMAMVGGNTKLVQDALPFVTTDGNPGRAVGLNVVGLRRAGLTASDLKPLKQAYRLLFHASLSLEAACQAMDALGDDRVSELVAFIRASKRGFAHERVAAG